MEKYAVFLRGINVGGKNIINMNDLKSALINKQFENVKSYINSGNIVLKHKGSRQEAAQIIKELIQSQFKLSIEVIVKTEKELGMIIENEPFSEKENDNSKKIVVMLSGKIDKEKALTIKDDERIEENFYSMNDLLYIYYHNGAGRSKFTLTYIEKKLNITATGRNWNTIIKMNEMLKEN